MFTIITIIILMKFEAHAEVFDLLVPGGLTLDIIATAAVMTWALRALA